MNATQKTLFERLEAFEFDQPGVELTFARRLARENAWSQAYAERVIGEYRRFVFLAMEAGHVVTPSEQVDQAWHLHLIYTRSYWDGLCREVLGRPLHHGPTQGGASEQAKYIGCYEQTLASYERFFGEHPPQDIWPPAVQRFGEDLRHVTVNTAQHWIIPKPRWPALPKWTRRLTTTTPLLALGMVGMPLVGAGTSPLDWRGPNFLALYAAITIAALVMAVIVRVVFAPAEDAPSEKQSKLNAYEVACLWSGPLRAVQAAFSAMVQAGYLRLVDEEDKLFGFFTARRTFIQQGQPLPANAPRLEHAIYDAAGVPAENVKPLVDAALPAAENIEESLRKRGLLRPVMPPASCFLASAIVAAPILLGLAKIAVGLSRGRPVGFLVAACVATAIAALVVLLARSRVTAAGRSLVEPLLAQQAHTRQQVEISAVTPSPAQVAMLVGLFGAGVLAAGPLSRIHALLPRSSGGGGCSTSSGGCGGGGGGCGGGGCGGGGCGGCGG